jgi:hypothetical protein
MGCAGWGIRATPEGWTFLPERQRPTGINIFENGMRWPTYDLTDNDNGPIILVYSGVKYISWQFMYSFACTLVHFGIFHKVNY